MEMYTDTMWCTLQDRSYRSYGIRWPDRSQSRNRRRQKSTASKLRQGCKRKAVDDITERPHKPIIAECGETENDTLVPDDISTIRQAVYRVRRRTQPKLPKSREETHVNLKDYEFNSTSCPCCCQLLKREI